MLRPMWVIMFRMMWVMMLSREDDVESDVGDDGVEVDEYVEVSQ